MPKKDEKELKEFAQITHIKKKSLNIVWKAFDSH
jgi:hypothetical protein